MGDSTIEFIAFVVEFLIVWAIGVSLLYYFADYIFDRMLKK